MFKEIIKRVRAGETIRFDNEDDCVKNQHDRFVSAEIEFSKSFSEWWFKVWFEGKIVLMSKTFPTKSFQRLVEKWNLKEVTE